MRGKSKSDRKINPTSFAPEVKPSVVIFYNEWTLWHYPCTLHIGDMFWLLHLCQIHFCIIQNKLCSTSKAAMIHIYLLFLKNEHTTQFLHISVSFMETVFHDNKIQMCSLAPFFWEAYCLWPNTANIWLSETYIL